VNPAALKWHNFREWSRNPFPFLEFADWFLKMNNHFLFFSNHLKLQVAGKRLFDHPSAVLLEIPSGTC